MADITDDELRELANSAEWHMRRKLVFQLDSADMHSVASELLSLRTRLAAAEKAAAEAVERASVMERTLRAISGELNVTEEEHECHMTNTGAFESPCIPLDRLRRMAADGLRADLARLTSAPSPGLVAAVRKHKDAVSNCACYERCCCLDETWPAVLAELAKLPQEGTDG